MKRMQQFSKNRDIAAHLYNNFTDDKDAYHAFNENISA